MKQRIRWYGLELSGVLLRRVADSMMKLEYTKRRAAGFRIQEARRDHLIGKFIERVEWDDSIDDPAGGEFTVHRVELHQVNFRLDATSPELQVTNPPRSLRAFTETLSECLERPIGLVEPVVSSVAWLDEIERHVGKTTVISMGATGLTLSASTSATINLFGTEDVRVHFETFTKGRTTNVERTVIRLPSPHAGCCELLSGGRATITDGNEATISTLRSALRARMSVPTTTYT